MSAELNIMDIASSIMRSVNKALNNMVGIKLMELPEVHRIEVPEVRIFAAPEVFTSLVTFQQSTKDRVTRGGVVLYIANSDLKNIFGSLEIDSMSLSSEIKDICGEFCNVIAGGFKTEIVGLGYRDVNMSTPTNYAVSVNESLGNINLTCKYKFSFSHKNAPLFVLEVFLEGAL